MKDEEGRGHQQRRRIKRRKSQPIISWDQERSFSFLVLSLSPPPPAHPLHLLVGKGRNGWQKEGTKHMAMNNSQQPARPAEKKKKGKGNIACPRRGRRLKWQSILIHPFFSVLPNYVLMSVWDSGGRDSKKCLLPFCFSLSPTGQEFRGVHRFN